MFPHIRQNAFYHFSWKIEWELEKFCFITLWIERMSKRMEKFNRPGKNFMSFLHECIMSICGVIIDYFRSKEGKSSLGDEDDDNDDIN